MDSNTQIVLYGFVCLLLGGGIVALFWWLVATTSKPEPRTEPIIQAVREAEKIILEKLK